MRIGADMIGAVRCAETEGSVRYINTEEPLEEGCGIREWVDGVGNDGRWSFDKK